MVINIQCDFNLNTTLVSSASLSLSLACIHSVYSFMNTEVTGSKFPDCFLYLSLSLRGPAFLSPQLRLEICCNFLMHFMFILRLWKIHILSDAGNEIIGSLLLQTRQENEQDAVI